jgi:hypothetical protein
VAAVLQRVVHRIGCEIQIAGKRHGTPRDVNPSEQRRISQRLEHASGITEDQA